MGVTRQTPPQAFSSYPAHGNYSQANTWAENSYFSQPQGRGGHHPGTSYPRGNFNPYGAPPQPGPPPNPNPYPQQYGGYPNYPPNPPWTPSYHQPQMDYRGAAARGRGYNHRGRPRTRGNRGRNRGNRSRGRNNGRRVTPSFGLPTYRECSTFEICSTYFRHCHIETIALRVEEHPARIPPPCRHQVRRPRPQRNRRPRHRLAALPQPQRGSSRRPCRQL